MVQAVNDVAASEEQHKKIDPIIEDARKRLQGVVQELIPVQPVIRRQKLAEFVDGVEEKIAANLSTEQAQSFREKVGDVRQEFLGGAGGRGAVTTQPAQPPPQRPVLVIERLHDYLDQVVLTDDQKTEVETLFSNARKKFRDLQQQGDTDVQKEQVVVQELRQELASILSPEQLGRLRAAVNQGSGGRRGGMEPPMPMAPPADAMMQPTVATKPTVAAPVETEAAMLAVGAVAPDFSLKRVDGTVAQLSQMKGKFVLIVFGSYSSPSFRQRAAALESINKSYGSRLVVLVIYTRENHPVGEWNVDRNKDDAVAVEQPTDMNGRLVLARQARSGLKLSVPFLLDSLDDQTAKAYAGQTNAAYLIGRDGTVVVRQKWFEPYAMRAAIDEALKESAASRINSPPN